MSRLRLIVLGIVAALGGVALVAAPAQAVAATVSGVIRDSNGQPVAGLTVWLLQQYKAEAIADETDADGVYQLTAGQGDVVTFSFFATDEVGRYDVGSPEFVLEASRVENFTLPKRATVTATVDEGDDGSPSPGASVTAIDARADVTGSGGLTLAATDSQHCLTAADGSCSLPVFRAGSVDHFTVSGSGRSAETFAGMPTPNPTQARSFVLAAAPKISGVLRAADGSGVPGATVSLDGSGVQPTVTGPDGTWSLRAQAGGPYKLRLAATVSTGGWTLPYEFESAAFQHAGPRTVTLAFAPLESVGINVRSSNGAAVASAWVQSVDELSTRPGATSEGLPVTQYLNRAGQNPSIHCTTSAAGRCTLPALSGGSSGQFTVRPPVPAQSFPASPYVPGQSREITAQLKNYATATSAGSAPGVVVGTTDKGDVPELDTRSVTLPDGLDPVVGRIDYRVTLPPGASSAVLSLDLPETHANALFRQRSDGDVDLLSTWGSPPGFLEVVDGSAADADGVVNGSVSGNVVPAAMARLAISTSELPPAVAQRPYSAQLQGTGAGGPMVWSVDPSTPLPSGLSLSRSGLLSGTAATVGSYPVRVLMSDSRGWQGATSESFTLDVDKVAVLTTSLPDGYVGAAYSATLTFASGSLPTWSLSSGSLPPGLKLASGSGVISGTPTAAGTYRFGVTVRANGSTSRPRLLSIVVHPMEIATASLPPAPVAAAYSQKLAVHGGKGTLSWSIAGGALPAGMTLSSGGVISGRPATVGTYGVTVRVTDSSLPKQTATQTLALTVTPMTITTTSLPDVKKGAYYSQLLTVSGGRTTLSWSLAAGSLPAGLTLSSAGRISGYPKIPGTWTFTVQVADSSVPKNTATRALSITVT